METNNSEDVAGNAEAQVADNSAPVTEATGAQSEPSLEELLEQFETKTVEEPIAQQTEKPAAEKADNSVNNDAKVYKDYIERQIQKEADRDLQKAVEIIKDTGEVGLPDRHIRAILEDKAKEDPRILTAWNKRNTSPKVFEDVMKAIGKELKRELGEPIDQVATQSVNAVKSAVLSGNQQAAKTDDAPDFWNMSKTEWEAHKRKANNTQL